MIRLKRFFRFQIRLSAKTWHLGPRLPHIFNFLIYCYGDTSTALILPVCSYKVNEKPSKLTDDVGIVIDYADKQFSKSIQIKLFVTFPIVFLIFQKKNSLLGISIINNYK